MRALLWASVAALLCSAASAQTADKGPYDAVCHHDQPTLVVALDMSSPRSVGELDTAELVKRFVLRDLQPGRRVQIFQDRGDGRPTPATPAMCKPVPCSGSHPLYQLFVEGLRTCTEDGFARELRRFEEAIEAAFAPYFKQSRSPRSRLLDAISEISLKADIGSAGAELVYLSDGLPNDPSVYPFSTKARWIVDEAARDELFETLRIRGARPALNGWTVHLIGFGRAFGDGGRAQGRFLSKPALERVFGFWRAYAALTGARVRVSSKFNPRRFSDDLRRAQQ